MNHWVSAQLFFQLYVNCTNLDVSDRSTEGIYENCPRKLKETAFTAEHGDKKSEFLSQLFKIFILIKI